MPADPTAQYDFDYGPPAPSQTLVAGDLAARSTGPRQQPWWLGIKNPHDGGLPPSVVARATWYQDNLRKARIRSQTLDVAGLVLTAAIPFVVAVNAPDWVPALLGALAAVVAGLRHVFGWQKDWIAFTRTSAEIEAEIVQYGIGRPPYAIPGAAAAELASRIEILVGKETAAWGRRSEGREAGGVATSPAAATG